ncbi:MAG: hypothetical protein M5U28_46230 [Sandaracinaceae bacterium]|nr:hypothetical protein [Sandaracinaceae bacterium]
MRDLHLVDLGQGQQGQQRLAALRLALGGLPSAPGLGVLARPDELRADAVEDRLDHLRKRRRRLELVGREAIPERAQELAELLLGQSLAAREHVGRAEVLARLPDEHAVADHGHGAAHQRIEPADHLLELAAQVGLPRLLEGLDGGLRRGGRGHERAGQRRRRDQPCPSCDLSHQRPCP